MRTLDLMPTEAQWLEGPDVEEVQAALGFTGRALDGVYGPDTAAAVELWKWRFGFPRMHVNNRLGMQGRQWLLGIRRQPADFARRASERAGRFPHSRGGVVPPLAVGMGHGTEFRVAGRRGRPRGRRQALPRRQGLVRARGQPGAGTRLGEGA